MRPRASRSVVDPSARSASSITCPRSWPPSAWYAARFEIERVEPCLNDREHGFREGSILALRDAANQLLEKERIAFAPLNDSVDIRRIVPEHFADELFLRLARERSERELEQRMI